MAEKKSVIKKLEAMLCIIVLFSLIIILLISFISANDYNKNSDSEDKSDSNKEDNFFKKMINKIIFTVTGKFITGFDTHLEGASTSGPQEEIMMQREKLKENLEYQKFLLEEGMISPGEAKIAIDLGELAIIDSDNIQDIIDNKQDLTSIKNAIQSIEMYLFNKGVGISKEAKSAAKEKIADLYAMKAEKMMRDIPVSDIGLYKKDLYIYPELEGCKMNYPKIIFKGGFKEILNEDKEVIAKEKVITKWKYSGEGDEKLRDITDIKDLHFVYEPLFQLIAKNNFDYVAFLDLLSNNEEFVVEEGKDNIEDYEEALKEYDKTIEILEELKDYYYSEIDYKKSNSGLDTYRQITLKLAQYYHAIKKYDKASANYDAVYGKGKYPLSKKDYSDVLLMIAKLWKNEKDIVKTLQYTEKAIKVYPLNYEALEYKKSIQTVIINIISHGTSQKYKEILHSTNDELYSWWGFNMRRVSIATPTEIILDEIENEQKKTKCHLLGLKVLKWVVEDGYDLASFYYDEVELPKEMYFKDNFGRLKIKKEYVIDYGEVEDVKENPNDPYSAIKILRLFQFYGENRRDETKYGREGENAEKLDIDVYDLVDYTNERDIQYQEIRDIITKIVEDRYENDQIYSNKPEFIEDMHECMEKVIRFNPDIALLAASGDYDKEIELLHKMGVYKSGAKKIPLVGEMFTGYSTTGTYLPKKHPYFKDYQVENFAVQDFVFKGGKESKIYTYTPIHETWGDFWLEQVNLINFVMIVGPALLLKPVNIYVGGTMYATSRIGAIPIIMLGGLGATGRAALVGSSSLETSYFVGNVLAKSSSLGLKTYLKITGTGAGLRSSLMSFPVLRALKQSSPWTFTLLKGGSQITTGFTVGTATFIGAEMIGGPALSIPVSFITDITLGGLMMNYRILPGLKKEGINVALEKVFMREIDDLGTIENFWVLSVPEGNLQATGNYLKSMGFSYIDNLELPSLYSSETTPTLKRMLWAYSRGGNIVVLRGPMSPKIVLEEIQGILRNADNNIINLAENGEINQELRNLIREVFETSDPQTVGNYAGRREIISYLYAQRTLDNLQELVSLREKTKGTFTIGIDKRNDIQLGAIKKGPDCCNRDIVWELWEVIDKNGRFEKEFRGNELYIKVDATGKAEVSLSEQALLGLNENSGKIKCEGGRVFAYGVMGIDENGDLARFSAKGKVSKAKKILNNNEMYMEAIVHKTARANGYLGLNSISMDEGIDYILRDIIKTRQGHNSFIDSDTESVLYELTVFKEEIVNGKRIAKVDLDGAGNPKKKLVVVDSEGNAENFNPEHHPSIWKERGKLGGKVILSDGKLRDAKAIGNMQGRTRVALIEDVTNTGYVRQYVFEGNERTLGELYNPKKYGHVLYETDTGKVFAEHKGKLVEGVVLDNINHRIVYRNPETEGYLVRDIDAFWNSEKNIFEIPEPRKLGERLKVVDTTGETIESRLLESPIFRDENTGETWVLREFGEGRKEVKKALAYDEDFGALFIDENGRFLIQPDNNIDHFYSWAGSDLPPYFRDIITGDVFIQKISYDVLERKIITPTEGIILTDSIYSRNGEMHFLGVIYEDSGELRVMLIDYDSASETFITTYEKWDYDVHGVGVNPQLPPQTGLYEDFVSGRLVHLDRNGKIIESLGLPERLKIKDPCP